jgi:hypothetical protein
MKRYAQDYMVYFSSEFKTRKSAKNNGMMYTFSKLYIQTSVNLNEEPPIYVKGEVLPSSYDWNDDIITRIFKTIPEEIYNPSVTKKVYERWLQDCSGCFTKPPTLERFITNVKNVLDESGSCAGITQDEEDDEWVLAWIPTKLVVDSPNFEINWFPCYKIKKTTRIPDLDNIEEIISSDKTIREISLKEPERGYIPTENQTSRGFNQRESITQNEWLQELNDGTLPFSDSPALRLDMEQDAAREKYRKRVRDARLRAKLARYRAERIAQRYEERYGVYPEEDEEEAQTEVEQSDEE